MRFLISLNLFIPGKFLPLAPLISVNRAQLPVLVGAVFFVYGRDGLFSHNQELQSTALVLFLLILILIHGPGRLSVDHQLKNR